MGVSYVVDLGLKDQGRGGEGRGMSGKVRLVRNDEFEILCVEEAGRGLSVD